MAETWGRTWGRGKDRLTSSDALRCAGDGRRGRQRALPLASAILVPKTGSTALLHPVGARGSTALDTPSPPAAGLRPLALLGNRHAALSTPMQPGGAVRGRQVHFPKKTAEHCGTIAVPWPNLPKPRGATPLHRGRGRIWFHVGECIPPPPLLLPLSTAGGYPWRGSLNRRRLTLNRRRLTLNRRRLALTRRRLPDDPPQSPAGWRSAEVRVYRKPAVRVVLERLTGGAGCKGSIRSEGRCGTGLCGGCRGEGQGSSKGCTWGRGLRGPGGGGGGSAVCRNVLQYPAIFRIFSHINFCLSPLRACWCSVAPAFPNV